MVTSIFCSKSQISVKELEDPIDEARGFMRGLKKRCAAHLENNVEYYNEILTQEKDISDYLQSVEISGMKIEKEIEKAEHVILLGKKIDAQKFCKILKYLFAVPPLLFPGITHFNGKSEKDELNSNVVITTMLTGYGAFSSFALSKIHEFSHKRESRVKELKLLSPQSKSIMIYFKDIMDTIKSNQENQGEEETTIRKRKISQLTNAVAKSSNSAAKLRNTIGENYHDHDHESRRANFSKEKV